TGRLRDRGADHGGSGGLAPLSQVATVLLSESSRAGNEPLPPPARLQPRGLVSLGTRGTRARERRRQADPALGWLCGLPLVPRDGARVLRGRGDRDVDERALRPGQGRPRGTAGRRLRLHGCRRLADRPRWLADDGLSHAHGRTVFWWDVLPARAASRPAQL